jgi:hypothetical protein
MAALSLNSGNEPRSSPSPPLYISPQPFLPHVLPSGSRLSASSHGAIVAAGPEAHTHGDATSQTSAAVALLVHGGANHVALMDDVDEGVHALVDSDIDGGDVPELPLLMPLVVKVEGTSVNGPGDAGDQTVNSYGGDPNTWLDTSSQHPSLHSFGLQVQDVTAHLSPFSSIQVCTSTNLRVLYSSLSFSSNKFLFYSSSSFSPSTLIKSPFYTSVQLEQLLVTFSPSISVYSIPLPHFSSPHPHNQFPIIPPLHSKVSFLVSSIIFPLNFPRPSPSHLNLISSSWTSTTSFHASELKYRYVIPANVLGVNWSPHDVSDSFVTAGCGNDGMAIIWKDSVFKGWGQDGSSSTLMFHHGGLVKRCFVLLPQMSSETGKSTLPSRFYCFCVGFTFFIHRIYDPSRRRC